MTAATMTSFTLSGRFRRVARSSRALASEQVFRFLVCHSKDSSVEGSLWRSDGLALGQRQFPPSPFALFVSERGRVQLGAQRRDGRHFLTIGTVKGGGALLPSRQFDVEFCGCITFSSCLPFQCCYNAERIAIH